MINSAIHGAPFASVYATGGEVEAFLVHVTISEISEKQLFMLIMPEHVCL